MRMTEIWTRAEVDEINARLRQAATDQKLIDASLDLGTPEHRAAFIVAMYGDDNSASDFEEAKLEKQLLANRKLALEIEQISSATTARADSLDNALKKAKIAQISSNLAAKSGQVPRAEA